jgi:hypothetical protein
LSDSGLSSDGLFSYAAATFPAPQPKPGVLPVWKIVIHTGLQTFFTVTGHGIAVMAMIGMRNDECSVGLPFWVAHHFAFIIPNSSCGFKAIHYRHLNIHKHQVIGFGFNGLSGFFSIGCYVSVKGRAF